MMAAVSRIVEAVVIAVSIKIISDALDRGSKEEEPENDGDSTGPDDRATPIAASKEQREAAD